VNIEMMESIFEQYMLMKRDVVREPEQDNDVPMLLYVGEQPFDDLDGNVLCIVVPGGRDEVIGALAATMARMFIPYWAAIASDGYTAKAADIPDEYIRAGGVTELFAQNSAAVKECLTLTACDHEGGLYATSRTYWYDSDGDVWFDDEEEASSFSEGAIIDILKDITSMWGKSHAEVIAEVMRRMPDMN
jgi:hypothetical protein